MSRNFAPFGRWLVGESRKRTGVAVLLAAAYVGVASLVEHRVLSREIAGGDPPALLPVRELFQVDLAGIEPTTAILGSALVVALAGLHAYYNLGYLTSVLLASSPSVGIALWSIHGFDEYVTLTPTLVLDRVFPEVPLLATLDFLLGIGLRRVIGSQLSVRSAATDAIER